MKNIKTIKISIVIFFISSIKNYALAKNNSQKIEKNPNLLAQLVYIDLDAMHKMLKKHYPAKKRSAFTNWVDVGYEKSLKMAKKVSTLGGYMAVIRFYSNGFNHVHISAKFLIKPTSYFWPNFLVAKKDELYVVVRNYMDIKYHKKVVVPPIGAALIACDKKKPDELMKINVAPYFYDTRYPSDGVQSTNFLFLDLNNPWFKRSYVCIFRIKGKVKSYHLTWNSINRDDILRDPENPSIFFEDYVFGKPPKLGVTYFEKNIWISIPSFFYEEKTDQDKKIMHIISAINSINNKKKNVIFDLRGNEGGFIEYIDLIYHAALKNNRKIYILTDNMCTSACWDFVALSKNYPNIVHLGRTTHSNDLCGDVKSYELPSHFAKIYVPRNCYNTLNMFKRFNYWDSSEINKIPVGDPFVPAYRFDGNMEDTKAIQKWVFKLGSVNNSKNE